MMLLAPPAERFCAECGISIVDKIERVRTCSVSCGAKVRNRARYAARDTNWARDRVAARLVDGPGYCQLWTGYLDPEGYGRLGYLGVSSVLMHRVVYQEFVGPIPDGFTIDHVCHTIDESCAGGPTCYHRRCGNWQHLEAVPTAENTRRGRSFSTENRLKTHCIRDHEFTPGNTRINRAGSRVCIACAETQYERTRMLVIR